MTHEQAPTSLEPDPTLPDEEPEDDDTDARSRWWDNLGCDVPCDLADLGCFDALPGLDALDCGCDLGCL